MRYAAEKRDLAEAITELREIAAGRDDIYAKYLSLASVMLYDLDDLASFLPRRRRTRRMMKRSRRA
jgi:hypothetical protein